MVIPDESMTRRLASELTRLDLNEMHKQDQLPDEANETVVNWASPSVPANTVALTISATEEFERAKSLDVEVVSSFAPTYELAMPIRRVQWSMARRRSRWLAECPGIDCHREVWVVYFDPVKQAAGCYECFRLTYLSRRKQNKRLDHAKRDLEGWLKKRAAMPNADPVVTARITIQALAWRRQRGLD